jgi:KDO2-lipid IV(A) lauroyltransferase
VRLACLLPLPALAWLSGLTAWAWWTVLPVRRAVALDNLRRAGVLAPGQRPGAVLRRHLRELVLGYLELVRWTELGAGSGVEVTVEGLSHLRAGLPVLVGHLGSWDLGILVVATASPVPIGVHVRPPRDAWARALIARLRDSAGLRALDPRDGMDGARRVMAEGGVMVFVHDQAHLRGPKVPLFGRAAHTSTGFARASLEAGQAVGAWISRLGTGRHVVRIVPLALPATQDVLARTAWANDWIEARVRAEPHAWLWMHRRWKGAD